MPETLLEAEECARTLDSINRRVSQTSEKGQLERLINALMISGQVPATATGTSPQPDNQQIQSINTKLDALANKLECVAQKGENSEKLAAYVEPERESQQGIPKLIRELTDNLRQEIYQQVQHLDARIIGLARRTLPNRYESQQPRQRTRDGRPLCFDCGNTGHVQQSCPYRRTRPIQLALPDPGAQRRVEQWSLSYNPPHAPPTPGPQRRMEPRNNRRQERLAAFEGVADEEENYGHSLADNDVGEQYYYNTSFRLSDLPDDHQDVLSLTYDDYRGRDKEGNLPSDLNNEQWNMLPPPQFCDEEYEDEFEWPSPPPPITDIALTEGELNIVPPPKPNLEMAVIDSDLDIVPPPPAANMAEIESALALVPPPPPTEDGTPHTDYLESMIPPPLEFRDEYKPPSLEEDEPQPTSTSLAVVKTTTNKDALELPLVPPPEFQDDYDLPPLEEDEPQLSSQIVATDTGDRRPPVTSDCQVDLQVVKVPLVSDMVFALETDSTEAEPRQHMQVMPNQVDKAHTRDQSEETRPTSFAVHGVTGPSGVKPNIATATKNSRKPHELTVPIQLNGKSTRFLLDTGASMSVIDYNHLQELYNGVPPMKQTSFSRAIQTVSGEHLPIVGTITVTLNVAGGAYPWELKVIKGLTYKAVLGRDFLRAHGAVINLQTGMLELTSLLTPIQRNYGPFMHFQLT